MKLNSQLALVTGGGSGIGEEVALRLAKEGAIIIVADKNKEAAEKSVSQLKDISPQSISYQIDVKEEREVKDLFKMIESTYNNLDILVNNAGIGIAANVVDTTLEDWDRVMDVNAKGVFLGCKYALPIMEKSGRGVIINTASVAGEVGVYNRAAYCASKAAVIGLTRSIAIDYADKGVRAVAVSPGTVESPWIDKILSNNPNPVKTRKKMEERQPIGRMGVPKEIANAISFLASEEASFVTGSNFIVDGGLTAQ